MNTQDDANELVNPTNSGTVEEVKGEGNPRGSGNSIEFIDEENKAPAFENNPIHGGIFTSPKLRVKNEYKKRIKPKQKSCRGGEEFIDLMQEAWGTWSDHLSDLTEDQQDKIKKHFNGLFVEEEVKMGDALFEDDFDDFNDAWN